MCLKIASKLSWSWVLVRGVIVASLSLVGWLLVGALLEGGSTQPGRNLKSSHVRNRFRKSRTACGLKTPSSLYPWIGMIIWFCTSGIDLSFSVQKVQQALAPTPLAVKGLQVHGVQMHRDALLVGEVWLSFRRRGRGSLLHPCVQSPECRGAFSTYSLRHTLTLFRQSETMVWRTMLVPCRHPSGLEQYIRSSSFPLGLIATLKSTLMSTVGKDSCECSL